VVQMRTSIRVWSRAVRILPTLSIDEAEQQVSLLLFSAHCRLRRFCQAAQFGRGSGGPPASGRPYAASDLRCQDEQSQLHALRQHHSGKLRLSDVKEMFEQMRDHA